MDLRACVLLSQREFNRRAFRPVATCRRDSTLSEGGKKNQSRNAAADPTGRKKRGRDGCRADAKGRLYLYLYILFLKRGEKDYFRRLPTFKLFLKDFFLSSLTSV